MSRWTIPQSWTDLIALKSLDAIFYPTFSLVPSPLLNYLWNSSKSFPLTYSIIIYLIFEYSFDDVHIFPSVPDLYNLTQFGLSQSFFIISTSFLKTKGGISSPFWYLFLKNLITKLFLVSNSCARYTSEVDPQPIRFNNTNVWLNITF